jgi:hypothetical protein
MIHEQIIAYIISTLATRFVLKLVTFVIIIIAVLFVVAKYTNVDISTLIGNIVNKAKGYLT